LKRNGKGWILLWILLIFLRYFSSGDRFFSGLTMDFYRSLFQNESIRAVFGLEEEEAKEVFGEAWEEQFL